MEYPRITTKIIMCMHKPEARLIPLPYSGRNNYHPVAIKFHQICDLIRLSGSFRKLELGRLAV